MAYNNNATIVDKSTEDSYHDPMFESSSSLQSYVLGKAQEWSDFTEANYFSQWDEYYSLWRGIWRQEDSIRTTERSKMLHLGMARSLVYGMTQWTKTLMTLLSYRTNYKKTLDFKKLDKHVRKSLLTQRSTVQVLLKSV